MHTCKRRIIKSSFNPPVTLAMWIFDTLPALTALLTLLLLLLLLPLILLLLLLWDTADVSSWTWFKLPTLIVEVTQGGIIGTSCKVEKTIALILTDSCHFKKRLSYILLNNTTQSRKIVMRYLKLLCMRFFKLISKCHVLRLFFFLKFRIRIISVMVGLNIY